MNDLWLYLGSLSCVALVLWRYRPYTPGPPPVEPRRPPKKAGQFAFYWWYLRTEAIHTTNWWVWYKRYQGSASWKKVTRPAVLARDGYRCTNPGCDSTYRLEVHHKTYERVGQEWLDDLTTLCHECHVKVTEANRFRRGRYRAAH